MQTALDAIILLVSKHPALGFAFEQAGGVKYITGVRDRPWWRNSDRETLLFSARRALVCVKETTMLTSLCRLAQEDRALRLTTKEQVLLPHSVVTEFWTEYKSQFTLHWDAVRVLVQVEVF